MNAARERMQAAARAVQSHLPVGCGFFILAFPFGESDEKAQYVSNARRADVIKAMHEFLERNPMSKPEDN